MSSNTRKRAAAGAPGVATRSSKVAKTDNGDVSKAKPKGRKGKKAIPTSKFKESALPLHVHITHTPPSVDVEPSKEEAPMSKDVGFIGSMSLVPSDFSTGSYGWKGSRRTTVELVGGDGKKEKVQVMFTFNAIVVGSKDAEADENGADAEELDDSNEGEEDPTKEVTADDLAD